MDYSIVFMQIYAFLRKGKNISLNQKRYIFASRMIRERLLENPSSILCGLRVKGFGRQTARDAASANVTSRASLWK